MMIHRGREEEEVQTMSSIKHDEKGSNPQCHHLFVCILTMWSDRVLKRSSKSKGSGLSEVEITDGVIQDMLL